MLKQSLSKEINDDDTVETGGAGLNCRTNYYITKTACRLKIITFSTVHTVPVELYLLQLLFISLLKFAR